MSLSVGDTLKERYRIDGFLKRGGMGAVYKAWDTALDMPVAVKENTIDTSSEAKKQFEREARILARLHHPNLPRVTNHFVINDQGQYLVMDLIEGDSLDVILHQLGRPLTGEEVLSWIRQVCDALGFLHQQDPPIIHRDIKPQNIIVTSAGKVMLVDFGIAKLYDPHQATTGGAKGVTHGFSPIEQYGRSRTDARSDVYALGATLYTLFTNGKPPPPATDRLAFNAPVIPPHQENPQIQAPTEKVIFKSLEIDTEKRYQTITDFYNDLESTLVVGAGPTVEADDDSDETIQSLPEILDLPDRAKSGLPKPVLFGGIALLVVLVVGAIMLLTGIGLTATSTTPALPTVDQAVIEMDGQTLDTDDFQAVACDTSPRIEVKFLDAEGAPIAATNFSYNWRFEPDDPNNEDKLNSSNYATIYHVPCELDSQTVIVQAQQDGKTFFTKSLLFDISQ